MVLDCPDPGALAAFYSALLGLPVTYRDDDWVVALGDVRGKGVEAAVVTALARHTLRAASFQMTCPSQALLAFNDVLLAHESDRFCTVVLMRLRPEKPSRYHRIADCKPI